VVVGQGTAVQKEILQSWPPRRLRSIRMQCGRPCKKNACIVVENGTVKAHGEEIKNVLVDGNRFLATIPRWHSATSRQM